MRPEVGFADLIRAIDQLDVTSYEEARAIAELIAPGYAPAALPPPARRPPPPDEAPKPPDASPRSTDARAQPPGDRPGRHRDDRRAPRPNPRSADQGDHLFQHELPPRPYRPAEASMAAPLALQGGSAGKPLGFLPMIEPGLARAIVSALIGRKELDGPVDLTAAVATLARRRPLLRIPRRRRHTLRFGAQLLIDVGNGMTPYWLDTAEVERLVRKIVGPDRVEVVRFRGPAAPVDPAAREGARPGPPPRVRAGDRWRPYAYPAPKSPVLALSDLGFASGGLRLPDEDRWLALAAGLAALGSPLIVLTPAPRDRWPARLAAAATIVQWDRATAHLGRTYGRGRRGANEPARPIDAASPLDPASWTGITHPDAYALARLVALTARCEPALLRLLRRTFLPSVEAWVEGELWFSPLADVRASAGLILRGDVTQALLDSWETDPKLPEVIEKIAQAHAHAPGLVQLHEQLAASLARGPGDAIGKEQVRELLAGVAAALVTGAGAQLADWARHVIRKLPRVLEDQPVAFQLAVAAGREHDALIGSGMYDRALVYSTMVAAGLEERTVPFDLRSQLQRSRARQRRIAVRREHGRAIFEPAAEGSRVVLSVPETWPALLDVYTADQSMLVAVADTPVPVPWNAEPLNVSAIHAQVPGAARLEDAGPAGPLEVYALDGQGWRLIAGDAQTPNLDAPWSSIVWTPPPPELAFGYVARRRAIAVPLQAVTPDDLEPVMVRIAGVTVQTRLLLADPRMAVAVLALEEDAAVPPLATAIRDMVLDDGILALELHAAAAPRVVPARIHHDAERPAILPAGWTEDDVPELDLVVVDAGADSVVSGMPVVAGGELAGMIGRPFDRSGDGGSFELIRVTAVEAAVRQALDGWSALTELASVIAQEIAWSAVEAAAAERLPRIALADASIDAFAHMGCERRSAALLLWARTASPHAVRHALAALESATRTIEIEIAVHALTKLVRAGQLDGPHARRARRHLDRISPAIFDRVLRDHVDELRDAVRQVEGAHHELKLAKFALARYHHQDSMALLRDRLQQRRRVVLIMGGPDGASQLGLAWHLHQSATGYLALAWTFRSGDLEGFCTFAARALGLPAGSGLLKVARRAAEVDASVLLDRFDRIGEDRDDVYAKLRAFVQPFLELSRGRCIFTFRGLVPDLGLGDACELVSFSGFPVEPELRQHLSASLEYHQHQVKEWLRALVGWGPIAAVAAMTYVVIDTLPRWAAALDEQDAEAFVAALRAWLDQPGPLDEKHQLALLGSTAGGGGSDTPLVTLGAVLFVAMRQAEEQLDGKAVDEAALGDTLARIPELLDQIPSSTIQAIVRRAYLGSGYVRDDVAEFVIAFAEPVEARAHAIAAELAELAATRLDLVEAGAEDDKLGLRASPAVFRKLRDRWRAGALSTLAGLRLRWLAESNPFPAHNDPQKGHWGGLPERNGRLATATVAKTSGSGYDVRLQVTARPSAPPLRGSVRFHIHDMFAQPVSEVPVRKGVAELAFSTWGAFTVGIECDRGKTHLELDLADTPEVELKFLDEDFTSEPGLAVASYGVELPLQAKMRWTYQPAATRPGAAREEHVMTVSEQVIHANGATASRIEGFLGWHGEPEAKAVWLVTRGDGKYHVIPEDGSQPIARLRDRSDELQDLLVVETLYLRFPARAGSSFANAHCSVHVRDVRFTPIRLRGLSKHAVVYDITQRWPGAHVKLSVAPGVGVISVTEHDGTTWRLVSYAERAKPAKGAGKKRRKRARR